LEVLTEARHIGLHCPSIQGGLMISKTMQDALNAQINLE